MKKLIYFLIAFMFISVIPEIAVAQSNDPFEQQTLKARDNTTKREKKISRKKDAESEVKEAPAEAPKQEVKKESTKQVNASEMTISNPCDEWLDVEFVSLIGSKSSQLVKLTIKFTNHDVNKHMYVGGHFLAYDCEGNEHARSWSSTDYNALTDIPIKATIDVPEKINPAKTQIMPVMKFDIGDCKIEMRNVPINWK